MAPKTPVKFYKQLFDLQNRVAVVIGGTGVLCGEMARGLLQAGCRIVLVGREKFLGAKGYALGLMIEILSSRLTGMPYRAHIIRKFDDRQNRAYMGHYIQAIDIEAFCPIEDFKKSMDELIADLKNQPTAAGVKEILIPGEPEWRKKLKPKKSHLKYDQA